MLGRTKTRTFISFVWLIVIGVCLASIMLTESTEGRYVHKSRKRQLIAMVDVPVSTSGRSLERRFQSLRLRDLPSNSTSSSDATPSDVASSNAVPSYAASNNAAPGDAAFSNAAPSYAAPSYTAPSYVASGNAAPNYATPSTTPADTSSSNASPTDMNDGNSASTMTPGADSSAGNANSITGDSTPTGTTGGTNDPAVTGNTQTVDSTMATPTPILMSTQHKKIKSTSVTSINSATEAPAMDAPISTNSPTSTADSTSNNSPTSPPVGTTATTSNNYAPVNTPTSAPTSSPTSSPASTPVSTPANSGSTNIPAGTPVSTPANSGSTNTPASTPVNTPVSTSANSGPTNTPAPSTPLTVAPSSTPPSQISTSTAPSTSTTSSSSNPATTTTNAQDSPDNSIIPVPSPSVLPTVSSGTSVKSSTPTDVPMVIVPPGAGNQPPNSQIIQLKLDSLPWISVVNNATLAAQIAVYLPQCIAQALQLNPSQVVIQAMLNVDGSVVVQIAIPQNYVAVLNDQIKNPTSAFYTQGTPLTQIVDSNFPLIAPGASDPATSSDGSNSENDENSGGNGVLSNDNGATANGSSPGSTSKALVIGLAVGGSTCIYAAITALVIRAYKKSKTRADARQKNLMYGQAITEPVMQES